MDKLWESRPHAFVHTDGLNVGLPDGQMGNSEVGHMNIGAGRIVYQDFTRISKAIEDGDLDINDNLTQPIDEAVANGRPVHLIGLLSPAASTAMKTTLLPWQNWPHAVAPSVFLFTPFSMVAICHRKVHWPP
ncbi:hypothetical protein HORIV_00570 [Vreelandella olivaria]|uniref:Metalloenzyme domain-containing protein n=1 Tax=Vreelandella olivaria TaxID=390919 RepID=A0ABN5WKT6_9GAMM|nr:hypothetical protein HORIV_00570 [Halomonas olivaria]